MYLDTDAIVLNRRKLSEADVALILFTRKAGRVQAIANGARNPRSRLMASSHPFMYGEFTLNKTKDTWRVNQANITESFYQLRESLDKLALGSYLLELTDAVIQENQTHNRLFDLLLESLSLIKGDIRGYNILRAAFETKLFVLNGVKPRLDGCALCGVSYDKTTWYFSSEEGGLICSQCRHQTEAGDFDDIMIRFMRFLQDAPLDVILKTRMSRSLVQRILWINRTYLRTHITQKVFKSLEIFNTEHYRGE